MIGLVEMQMPMEVQKCMYRKDHRLRKVAQSTHAHTCLSRPMNIKGRIKGKRFRFILPLRMFLARIFNRVSFHGFHSCSI